MPTAFFVVKAAGVHDYVFFGHVNGNNLKVILFAVGRVRSCKQSLRRVIFVWQSTLQLMRY